MLREIILCIFLGQTNLTTERKLKKKNKTNREKVNLIVLVGTNAMTFMCARFYVMRDRDIYISGFLPASRLYGVEVPLL